MISDPVFYIEIVAILLAVLTILIVLFKGHVTESKYKKYVFMLFVIPTLLVTFYLAGHTVYKNIHSETGGPVHWHADFEIWVCGEKLDLVNPTGLKNKIGTPLFHEHDDDRIHVEGTVKSVEDVNVGSFFKTVGGKLTSDSFSYPIASGETINVRNGQLCENAPSELRVYVNGKQIEDPANYMYYPHPGVPPGDCIIVEFGANLKDTTDKVCIFWESAGWNYDNYKEKRQEPHNAPVWTDENWEYIDGKGMVRSDGGTEQ